MTETETAMLLALIARFDNRKPDDAAVAAWYELLVDVEYGDAVTAVQVHFSTSTDYLRPAHVIQPALAAAARRVGRERVELLARRAAELEAAPVSGTPPRDRSPELAALLAELAEKAGPGDRDQLRYRDKTLFGPKRLTEDQARALARQIRRER